MSCHGWTGAASLCAGIAIVAGLAQASPIEPITPRAGTASGSTSPRSNPSPPARSSLKPLPALNLADPKVQRIIHQVDARLGPLLQRQQQIEKQTERRVDQLPSTDPRVGRLMGRLITDLERIDAPVQRLAKQGGDRLARTTTAATNGAAAGPNQDGGEPSIQGHRSRPKANRSPGRSASGSPARPRTIAATANQQIGRITASEQEAVDRARRLLLVTPDAPSQSEIANVAQAYLAFEERQKQRVGQGARDRILAVAAHRVAGEQLTPPDSGPGPTGSDLATMPAGAALASSADPNPALAPTAELTSGGPASGPVPEPASVLIWAIAAGAAGWRFRRGAVRVRGRGSAA